jgi:hypothetical protein
MAFPGLAPAVLTIRAYSQERAQPLKKVEAR